MKKTIKHTLLIIFNLFCFDSFTYLHESSYPYISGDTFRELADFIFDDEASFNPNDVKNSSIIFVKGDFLEHFFTQMHPHISEQYIILTHNSDASSPGAFKSYLDDKKIIAWFGQNPDGSHPKFFPLPIGLANKYWRHGNILDIETVATNLPEKKKVTAYINFSIETNYSIRYPIYTLLHDKPFCSLSQAKIFKNYLQETSEHAFVISPHGNGLDCHRTWEALLLGCIPIVKSSTLDSLYSNLPVLIVNDWSDITQTFLQEQYAIISTKTYNIDKLYADYWYNFIKSFLP